MPRKGIGARRDEDAQEGEGKLVRTEEEPRHEM